MIQFSKQNIWHKLLLGFAFLGHIIVLNNSNNVRHVCTHHEPITLYFFSSKTLSEQLITISATTYIHIQSALKLDFEAQTRTYRSKW